MKRLVYFLVAATLVTWFACQGIQARAAGIYDFTTFAGSPGIGRADGPGAAARFDEPSGIAVDAAGSIYVADTENRTIRKITPEGLVTTFAGFAGSLSGRPDDGPARKARFNDPRGLALDSNGNLYVADVYHHALRKVTPDGYVTTVAGATNGTSGSIDAVGQAARFNRPSGVAVDSSGNLYVADTGNNTIRKVSPGGVVTTIAGTAGEHGNTDGPAATARFNSPTGIAVDPAGNLFVADEYNHAIRKISASGVVTTIASGTPVRRVTSVCVASGGTIYAAVADGHVIQRIAPDSSITTIAGTLFKAGSTDGVGEAARFRSPQAIAIDSAGNLFVADTGNHTIRKITSSRAVSTMAGQSPVGYVDAAGSAARFNRPAGIALDDEGNVFVLDESNQRVRRITPSQSVTTFASLDFYSGAMARDRFGNFYFVAGTTVRKMTSGGAISILAGSTSNSGTVDGTGSDARFYYPYGIAVDSGGTIYVSEPSHTIRKISPSGAVMTLAGSPGVSGSADGIGANARFNFPRGLACDASGNVYVADQSNQTIRKITPDGVVSTIAGAPGEYGSNDGPVSQARFSNPNSLSIDGAGLLYIGEGFRIRKMTLDGMVSTLGGGYDLRFADGTGPAARFYSFEALVADNSGTIYIADTKNHLIRKGAPYAETSIADGAGNSGWTWQTGGAAPWIGSTVGGPDEGKLIQSGPVDYDKNSWVETAVHGPGTLRFWWRVSSDPNRNFLTFSIGGLEQARISGETVWEQRSIEIPAGARALRWSYGKIGGYFVGQDMGFLANVEFEPAPEPVAQIGWIAPQQIVSGAEARIPVTIVGGGEWNLSARSSDIELLPDASMRFEGAGEQRWLIIHPQEEKAGRAVITVDASNSLGSVVSRSFMVLVVTPVLDRVQISAGSGHVILLRSDGTLWEWGSNHSGELGAGGYGSVNKPVPVGSWNDWKVISGGSAHTLAIRQDGSLWAWGRNVSGQLGIGNNDGTGTPVRVGDATDWVSIFGGGATTFGVRADGSLWAWGNNEFGQLGDGTTTFRNAPVRIGAENDWVTVSPGIEHTVGLRADGSLWAWGRNQYGQLGDGTLTDQHAPVQVSNSEDWQRVSAGRWFTVGLRSDGTLWGWGWNEYGQLGESWPKFVEAPVPTANGNDWVDVIVGSYHVIAIRRDGTLWAWGNNGGGELGDGSFQSKGFPVQVGTASDWAAISAGANSTIGLRFDGSVWAWGSNNVGQVGDGTAWFNIPQEIESPRLWKAVSGGGSHSLGIAADSTLWAWGENGSGQLGDGLTIDRSVPVQIGDWNDWESVSAGDSYSTAIRADGTLWTWGSNYSGQLGDGSITSRRLPARVGTANDWSQVDAGSGTTLALKRDGTLWAWGFGAGDGGWEYPKVPVQVGTSTAWKMISSGEAHRLALDESGLLWGWGSNGSGGLGDGSKTAKYAPTLVLQERAWKSVTAGGDHSGFSLGIQSDGSLWGWGDNYYGQLGNGTVHNDSTLPIRVGESNDWVTVDSGDSHSIGMRADGSIWVCGYTYVDPDGSKKASSTPTRVGTDSDWAAISAGGGHNLGIRADSTLWSWGINTSGQLGIGVFGQKSSPVYVMSAHVAPMLTAEPNDVIVVAGNTLTLGVTATGTAPFTFKWFKGELEITGAQGDTLEIINAQLQHAGSYTVVVSNVAGQVTNDAPAVVTVVVPPTILTQPAAVTVTEGADATFAVVATGTPPLYYQWRKNSLNIAGADAATYSISASQPDDSGTYDVQVSNDFGAVVSLAVSLSVAELVKNTPPQFEAPADRVGDEESLFSFTIQAVDHDVPEQLLTYSLESGAPVGAQIDQNSGLFTWTPSEAQGPSTNAILVRVTDNGTPPLSATVVFTIVVNEVNSAPVIATIAPQTVEAGGQLQFVVAASDRDLPPQTLVYSLESDAPDGATLRPDTGLFGWQPPPGTQAATNYFTVRVTDSGSPPMTATALVEVTVSTTNTVPEPIRIAGKTLYYTGNRAVPGVAIDWFDGSGIRLDGVVSASDGAFERSMLPNKDYSVRASRPTEEPVTQGVTTLDISLVRRHILGILEFDSPLKLLAADVNRSGSVTTLDISLIRRLILGINNSYPGGSVWRFVRSDFQFSDPLAPWAAPELREYAGLAADALDQNFIAIKLGDVNGSWTHASGDIRPHGVYRETGPARVAKKGVGAGSRALVRLDIGDANAGIGGSVRIPVTVQTRERLTSLQTTVAWNSDALSYRGVEGFGLRGLDSGNFGTTEIEKGRLTISWDDPNGIGVEVSDGQKLFDLILMAISSENATSTVDFVESPTSTEVTVDLSRLISRIRPD